MAESGRCVAWRRESSCWFFILFLMEKCPSERSQAVGSTLGQDPGRGGVLVPTPITPRAGPGGRVLAPTPITPRGRPQGACAGSHPHHGSTEAQVIGLLSCPPRVFSSPFLSLSPPHTRP